MILRFALLLAVAMATGCNQGFGDRETSPLVGSWRLTYELLDDTWQETEREDILHFNPGGWLNSSHKGPDDCQNTVTDGTWTDNGDTVTIDGETESYSVVGDMANQLVAQPRPFS